MAMKEIKYQKAFQAFKSIETEVSENKIDFILTNKRLIETRKEIKITIYCVQRFVYFRTSFHTLN